MSKYGVFSGLYFPVFGLNTEKYGPEKLRIWTLFTQCSCWLYYTILWLIRSELYCFGIRIQKNVLYCLYRSRINYIWLIKLTIQKTTKAKLSQFVIYIEATFICCDIFINFLVVAVFISFSSSWQLHYHSHACYNFGKNLTSNEILVT